MLLGASIGLADGVMGLHAWYMLGQPDFFVRRGWEMSYVVFLIFCGALTGIVYGNLLVPIARSCAGRLRLGRIYCLSMILAIPVFFCVRYVIIANRVSVVVVNFVPEVFVFLLSVALAQRISNKKELQ
jgi:hypothetical protein